MQNNGYFVVLWERIFVELLSCHLLNCYDSYWLFNLYKTAIYSNFFRKFNPQAAIYMISVTNWDSFVLFIFKVKNNKSMIFQ